jgi:hypothetical protein
MEKETKEVEKKIYPALHALYSRHYIDSRWVVLHSIENETLPILTESEMLEYAKIEQYKHLFEFK